MKKRGQSFVLVFALILLISLSTFLLFTEKDRPLLTGFAASSAPQDTSSPPQIKQDIPPLSLLSINPLFLSSNEDTLLTVTGNFPKQPTLLISSPDKTYVTYITPDAFSSATSTTISFFIGENLQPGTYLLSFSPTTKDVALQQPLRFYVFPARAITSADLLPPAQEPSLAVPPSQTPSSQKKQSPLQALLSCVPQQLLWSDADGFATLQQPLQLTLRTTGNCEGVSFTFSFTEEDMITSETLATVTGVVHNNVATIAVPLTFEQYTTLTQEAFEGKTLELRARAVEQRETPQLRDELQALKDFFSFASLSFFDSLDGVSSSLLEVSTEDITLLEEPQPPQALMGAPLQENQVFIVNKNTFAVTNHLVSVPISFEDEQYLPSDLWKVRLQDPATQTNLRTQVQDTSYYVKTGYVRTAVAHVIVPSLQVGEEKIYTIIEDTTPQTPFQRHSDVATFFTQGILSATSTDTSAQKIPYRATVPLNQFGTTITPVLNGPVIRVYEYHRAHRPTITPAGLTHLFSSQFYVTEVHNTPVVRVQQLTLNSHNYDEITWDANWAYSEPQNGDIFYDTLYSTINTGGASATLYLLDQAYLNPTTVSQAGNIHTVTIMPANGQQIISNILTSPCCANGLPSSVAPNYIAAGQGFLTQYTLNLGSLQGLNYDYFVESKINSGQSLARYNKVDNIPYRDIPDPKNLGIKITKTTFPEVYNWDFMYDAARALQIAKGDPSTSYRFSEQWLGTRYPASSGPNRVLMEIEPDEYTKYLMSCHDRCEPNYVDALRYWAAGVTYTTDHLIGYHPEEHPEAFPWSYATLAFTHLLCTEGDDTLGFCNQIVTPAPYKYSFGTGNGGASHSWVSYDDAHFAVSRGAYYYMATGDFMARDITKSSADIWTTVHAYNINKNYATTLTPNIQARALGRGPAAFAKSYQTTLDPFYKQTLEGIPQLLDIIQNKQTTSTATHPLTGDPLAINYLRNDFCQFGETPTCPVGYTSSACQACFAKVWQESLAIWGLGILYADILQTPAALQYAEQVFDRYLNLMFTYAYKEPTQVRNGIQMLHTTQQALMSVNEGGGYFTNDVLTGPLNKPPFPTFAAYNVYGNPFYQWIHYPLCLLATYYTPQDPTLLANLQGPYLDKMKRAYLADRIFYNENDNAGQNALLHTLTLSGDLYQGPTASSAFKAYDACPLTRFLNIPTAAQSQITCTDNDADGWSTCIGDCDDNNAAINPSVIESCGDTIDNNCNLQIDCNDHQCTRALYQTGETARCTSSTYCGDLSPQTQEQCDVVAEIPSQGTNTCQNFQCIPAYIYSSLAQTCTCGSQAGTFPVLQNILPGSITNAQNTLISLVGTGFDNPGATYTFNGVNPGFPISSQSSTLIQFTLPAGYSVGTYQVRVVNLNSQTSNPFPMTVNPVPFDFSLVASPTNSVVQQGSSTTVQVTVNYLAGASQAVSLSATNLPSGVTANFNPTTCTPTPTAPCTSTLTLQASASTPLTSTTINIQGISGSLTKTTPLTLTVQPVPFDYSIRVNPTSSSIQQGQNAQTTVTATLVSGATRSISFAALNLPSSVAATFNPTSCTPQTGQPCTSTLTLATTATTPAVSNHQITVQGTGGSLLKTIPFTLSVIAQAPQLTGFSPPTVTSGTRTIVTLLGNFFTPTTIVIYNNQVTYPSQFVNSNQISIDIPFTTPPGPYSFRVFNENGLSEERTLQVVAPQATITSLSAATLTNNQQNTLTITGTNFISGAEVLFNGQVVTLQTTIQSTTTITVIIPSGFAPNIYQVAVRNPTGQPSNALPLVILPPSPFDFSIAANPASGSVQQGQPLQTFVTATQLSGSTSQSVVFSALNLPAGVSATFNPTSCTPTLTTPCTSTLTLQTITTTPLGATTITLQGTSSSLVKTTPYTLTVTSQPQQTPQFTGFSPNAVLYRSLPTTVTLLGSAFTSGTVVALFYQGTYYVYISQFISSTRLTMTVPITAQPGFTYQFLVFNTNGISGTQPLTIVAPPLITALSQNAVLNTQQQTITITGTNFDPQAVVLFNGQVASLPTTVQSATSILLTIPVRYTAGVYQLKVRNPDGQESNPQTLTVQQLPPQLTSIVPSIIFSTQNEQVTLTGTDFDYPGATVTFDDQPPGSEVVIAVMSATTIELDIAAGYIPGTYQVRVVNLDGQESNPLPLTFQSSGTSSPPNLLQLDPNIITNNQENFVNLIGTDFDSGAQIKVDGQYYPANLYSYYSSTLMTMQVLQNTAAGVQQVLVENSDGQESAELPLIIQNPTTSPSGGSGGGGGGGGGGSSRNRRAGAVSSQPFVPSPPREPSLPTRPPTQEEQPTSPEQTSEEPLGGAQEKTTGQMAKIIRVTLIGVVLGLALFFNFLILRHRPPRAMPKKSITVRNSWKPDKTELEHF